MEESVFEKEIKSVKRETRVRGTSLYIQETTRNRSKERGKIVQNDDDKMP